MLELRPALVVVYGDVNSTLAAALVAPSWASRLAHVEAGLRSFDMTMPEEVNRRVTDILSDLLFVTSPEALDNLAHEGVPAERVHLVGNPMIDTLLAHLDRFDVAAARAAHDLGGPRYAVATLHRPANVDTPAAATRLVACLAGRRRAAAGRAATASAGPGDAGRGRAAGRAAACRSIEPAGLLRVPVAGARRRTGRVTD